MAAPNIVEVTNIIGATDVANLVTSFNTITSNPAASGKVYKINSLIISNIDGENDADVSVVFHKNDDYYIAKTLKVPADTTLVVISKDMGIYLEEGTLLKCMASAANDLQAICSYEIIT